MISCFNERLKLHRTLVAKNLLTMIGYPGVSAIELEESARQHDLSKYEEPEHTAYVYLTWKYYCQKNAKEYQSNHYIEKIIETGWRHHIEHNSHHPEAHIHFNQMSLLDRIEMISDWTAISQENGLQSCRNWAEDNMHKKWQFSEEMQKHIFILIDELDRRNRHNRDCNHD